MSASKDLRLLEHRAHLNHGIPKRFSRFVKRALGVEFHSAVHVNADDPIIRVA